MFAKEAVATNALSQSTSYTQAGQVISSVPFHEQGAAFNDNERPVCSNYGVDVGK